MDSLLLGHLFEAACFWVGFVFISAVSALAITFFAAWSVDFAITRWARAYRLTEVFWMFAHELYRKRRKQRP